MSAARILILGAGGLGCPASLALARTGSVRLTVVDDDLVELSNLPRQRWHRTGDVGRPKVASLAAHLAAAFPDIEVTPLHRRLTADEAPSLFAGHQVVIDGTDGPEGKFHFSDAALQAGVPLIHGGVLRWEGVAFPIIPGGPCLRCLFEVPPPPELTPTCASAGVMGPMAGWVGAQQAQLALQVLRDPGSLHPVHLHRFDGRRLRWRTTPLSPRPGCGCGASPSGELRA